jgi:hypothetical protein
MGILENLKLAVGRERVDGEDLEAVEPATPQATEGIAVGRGEERVIGEGDHGHHDGTSPQATIDPFLLGGIGSGPNPVQVQQHLLPAFQAVPTPEPGPSRLRVQDSATPTITTGRPKKRVYLSATIGCKNGTKVWKSATKFA